jgi:hypothetical protein
MVTIEEFSRNSFDRAKAISIIYSECVSVALIIQHAKLMSRIITSSVACLVLQYFSTLSHKLCDFRKKSLNIKFCFGFLYNVCLKHFSFCEIFSEIS